MKDRHGIQMLEELADNLEAYTKQLYQLRAKMQKDEMTIADWEDYHEAVEIKAMWEALGNE